MKHFIRCGIYIPFVEKGIKLLKKFGLFGFIIPDTLEKAEYSSLLKDWILKNYFVPQIDYFPNSYIFKSQNKTVGVKNILLFVEKVNGAGKKTRKIIHKEDYK